MKLGQTLSLILAASSAFAQTATSNGLQASPTKLPGNVGVPAVQVATPATTPAKKAKTPAAKPKNQETAPSTEAARSPFKSTSSSGQPKFVTSPEANNPERTTKSFKSTSKSVITTAPKAMVKAVEPKKAPELTMTGRRDPFVSPIVKATGLAATSGCDVGKKCLMADQVALKGIVKSETGMIALVENSSHRAYFLHENDPIFNGTVIKITPDSIVFRENITDKFGKPSIREVTKKVNAPVV